MPKRKYIEYCNFKLDNDDYVFEKTSTDPYDEKRERWDDILHKALSDIFNENCSRSNRIKKRLANQKSITDLILKKNPALREIFPRKNEFPLLWIAVLGCYQKSAELLVHSGANVNEPCFLKVPDEKRYCLSNSNHFILTEWAILHLLLHMYPSKWNEQFFVLVMNHGADLEARLEARLEGQKFNNETLLHAAVQLKRVRLIELLLEKGVNVNATTNRTNMTPLLKAVCCRDQAEEIVPLLIKYGADVTARNYNGENALHYLPTGPVKHADQVAKILIEKGTSPIERSYNCHVQPIHMAVRKGKNELVNILLDNGADVNALTRQKPHLYMSSRTPIMCAFMMSQNPEVLTTLLKRGANVALTTSDGNTALHEACNSLYYSKKDNREMIKILLSVGMNMCKKNMENCSPLATLIKYERYHYRVGQNSSIRVMLKTLALKKVCMQPSIEFENIILEDEMNIRRYPELKSYYENCIQHVKQIKSMGLIRGCTLFDLLTKCRCYIVPFIKNREFKEKFELLDLGDFSATYAEDIHEAVERAQLYHNGTMKQIEVINKAVHNILPCLVVEKVVHYMRIDCEKCELKKIVKINACSTMTDHFF